MDETDAGSCLIGLYVADEDEGSAFWVDLELPCEELAPVE